MNVFDLNLPKKHEERLIRHVRENFDNSTQIIENVVAVRSWWAANGVDLSKVPEKPRK